MATYRLLTPAFVDGVYHPAGTVISTAARAGKDWVAVDPAPKPTPRKTTED